MESISIKNLKFSYTTLISSESPEKQKKISKILDGVNLSLEKGDILCITGKSGEGKSTFLRVVAGLEKAASGEISLFGEPVKQNEWTALSMALKGVGFVFQNDALISDLTVKDNIAIPLHYHKMGTEEEIEQKAQRALMLMLASSFAKEYPSSLSLGIRKRVAIARAWALDARILLLDEPTAGLDKNSRINLLSLVDNLRELYKTTIIMVVSDLQVANDLNSKISFLIDKKLTPPMYFNEIKDHENPHIRGMVS